MYRTALAVRDAAPLRLQSGTWGRPHAELVPRHRDAVGWLQGIRTERLDVGIPAAVAVAGGAPRRLAALAVDEQILRRGVLVQTLPRFFGAALI